MRGGCGALRDGGSAWCVGAATATNAKTCVQLVIGDGLVAVALIRTLFCTVSDALSGAAALVAIFLADRLEILVVFILGECFIADGFARNVLLNRANFRGGGAFGSIQTRTAATWCRLALLVGVHLLVFAVTVTTTSI